jgi:hypothetical protein
MTRRAVIHDAIRTFAGLVAVVCVAGCSHASAKPVNGPDGEPGWFAISCKKDEGYCEEKAGDVCPGGYDVMDAAGHEGVAAVATVNPSGGSAYVVPTYRGHMLIKCKGAPANP